MTILHHLDDATLVAYAAGTLGEAHQVVVASHLAFCRQCRNAVRAAEAIGGGLLVEQEQSAVSDSCRAATLASLGLVMERPTAKRPAVVDGVPVMLTELLKGKPLSELRWKTRGPGIAKVDIALNDGGKTHLLLMRIGPGRKMPEHGHGGEELTLILKGSYSDHTGRYRPGDVADLDEDIEHQPHIDSDEDCICLIATEAPTKFKSFWARLAQPFVGI